MAGGRGGSRKAVPVEVFVFFQGCRMGHSEPWCVLSTQRPRPVTNGAFRDRPARGLRVVTAAVSFRPPGSTCLPLSAPAVGKQIPRFSS